MGPGIDDISCCVGPLFCLRWSSRAPGTLLYTVQEYLARYASNVWVQAGSGYFVHMCHLQMFSPLMFYSVKKKRWEFGPPAQKMKAQKQKNRFFLRVKAKKAKNRLFWRFFQMVSGGRCTLEKNIYTACTNLHIKQRNEKSTFFVRTHLIRV